FEAFLHAGSSSEYGDKKYPPKETEWLDPNSNYAVAKASATMFCRYTSISQNVPITTLRLYSAYGPFEEPNRLVPKLIIHGFKGDFPLLVSPDTARDFIYVEDVCDAFIQAATKAHARGSVYNLGTGVQTTLREAVEAVRHELKIAAEPQWGSMPARIWDTNVW